MGENRLRKILELDKCERCKRGDFSDCNHGDDSPAFVMDGETGKRKNFCCVACSLLHILNEDGPEAVNRIATDQYTPEGDYRKMKADLDYLDIQRRLRGS